MEDSRARFDAGAAAWGEYNRKPLGRIRREVTWHNLAPHLPAVTEPESPPRILDVGGGSGELALRLVQRGYRVWLADFAPGMLDQARQAAEALPQGARDRLTLRQMAADDAGQAFAPGSFDAITCHTLIEFLPQPRATLSTLAGLLCPGGLLSVSFANRYSVVLRQVWSQGDPSAALAQLEEGGFCASLFELPGTAYTAGDVGAWLEDLDLAVTAVRGVRAFADYVPRQRLDEPEFFDALLRLEMRVAELVAYHSMARYSHLLANKGTHR